jgi:uncharacterized protein YjdB
MHSLLKDILFKNLIILLEGIIMKKKYKSRILSLIAATLLTISCLNQVTSKNVYATSNVQDLLITEVMPMSQTNIDAYEYIELYNKSDRNIDLKDYKLTNQNIDITTSKVIAPKGILVVCTKGSTTLNDFNTFYNTALTSDKYVTLPFIDEVLSNNSTTSIRIDRDDTATVVVRAQYSTTDFQVKKGVTYKYAETGIDMLMIGQSQVPTPGSVAIEQVPQSGIKVTGITLDKALITMDINQTAAIYATVTPTTAANKTVVWVSSNSNIVEVSQQGKVTSKAEGVAYVSATTVDGGLVAICSVVVKRIPVTGITINKPVITMDVNQTTTIYATIAPGTATNKAIVWTSSNSGIIEVNQKGVITSKAEGTAYITARTVDNGMVAVCTVFIKKIPVKGITLNKANASIEVGKSIRLTALFNPENATNKLVNFGSNNSNIATVDSNGIVVGKAIGEAIITATAMDGSFKSTCIITVKKGENNSDEILSIRLNKKSMQIKEGKFKKLTPLITPGNLKKTGLTWISSDEEVAYVNEDGRVFGKKEGNAIITVTTKNGTKATCNVQVTSGKEKGKEKNKENHKENHNENNKGKDKGK